MALGIQNDWALEWNCYISRLIQAGILPMEEKDSILWMGHITSVVSAKNIYEVDIVENVEVQSKW